MKGLNTLIKLSKRTLDELRRNLTSLENQKIQLQQAITNLQAEMEQEMHTATNQPEMARFFGEFAKRIRLRQEELLAEIARLDAEMEKLREAISVAFAELKKYEIALENFKQRKKEEAQRRENEMLDEIAGMAHQRNKEN